VSVGGNKVTVHGVAHVEQLANSDAFSELEYFTEWRGTVQEVYSYYHLSGKKRFSLASIAQELGDSLKKITGTHGIRWAASQARTITALLQDLPSVVLP